MFVLVRVRLGLAKFEFWGGASIWVRLRRVRLGCFGISCVLSGYFGYVKMDWAVLG